MICLKLLLIFISSFCISECYKILAVFPVPMHSHYTLSLKIINKLAERGHEVTFVTPYPRKQNLTNVKEISVKSIVYILNEHKKKLYDLNDRTVFGSVKFLTSMGYAITEHVLSHGNVQNLLKSNEKYDLVMIPQFLNEGLLGIAHYYEAPLVLLATMPLFPWGSFLLAHQTPPSYVPNLMSQYRGHMNFWQRLLNTIYDFYSILYHQWFVLPKHKELVEKYIPGRPNLYNFLNNASLLLLNAHESIYEAMPQVPNTIQIGGYHLEEAKKLPKHLQDFLDSSTNGVVLFSMGSNLNTSSLDENKQKALLGAFSKLKENVLWKWEKEQLPGQPKNVKLMKWLPQSDILGHPNVKAFITHGGLLSTMESIYNGVPLVGIPVFSDQKMNMAHAVSSGYALVVPLSELNEKKLSNALEEILTNPKYKTNACQRSKIMRDRPIKPLDYAVYWIEYVVRHKGAPHLRHPGVDLNWFQRNLIDVSIFIISVIFLIIVIIKFVVKKLKSKNIKKKVQ